MRESLSCRAGELQKPQLHDSKKQKEAHRALETKEFCIRAAKNGHKE